MRVIVCSKNNEFASVITKRLTNEKHEVYYITGNDEVTARGSLKVFQKYDFNYTNESVVKVMNNIDADVLIIAGAMDFDLFEENSQNRSVEYISSMTNLILSAKMAKIKRIIYCSSLKVFETVSERSISKSTKPSTSSFDNGALQQVENFVMSCRDDENSAIDIIRFPEIYANHSMYNSSTDICAKMIDEKIVHKQITYNPEAYHMLIHVEDAIQVVMNTFNGEEENCLYHISAELCNEKDLASTISSLDNVPTETIAETADGYKQPFPLNLVESDNEKLNYNNRHSIRNDLRGVYKKIVRAKERKGEENDDRDIARIFRTVLETSAFFLLISFVQFLIISSPFAINIDLYIVFVVVISVIYGISYSLFSTVLAAAGKVGLGLYSSYLTSTSLDYQVFLELLVLAVCGIVIGLMRDRYVFQNQDLKDKTDYAIAQHANISRINDSNVYIKNIYGKRITAYSNNLTRLYNITSQLSFLNAKKVIFQTAKVVSEFVETEHVAIYVASKRSNFFRLAAATSEKGNETGKSIRFDNSAYFYDALTNRDVYMNRNFNTSKPTYITAIYGKDENIEAIIMIWANDLSQISAYQSSLITVLSRLIENTLISALEYDNLYFENSYIADTKVLQLDAFLERISIFDIGADMGLMSYTIMKLSFSDYRDIEEVMSSVESVVRDTDYIGSDMVNIYVLLYGADENEAEFVTTRFKQQGFETEIITKNEITRVSVG